MARKEFPKSVKVAAVKRAMRNGQVYCENPKCGVLCKQWEIDHDDADGLTGQPTLENAVVLCIPCHAKKTREDVRKIAKAKRREAARLGVRKQPTLKSAPFAKAEPQRRATKPVEKLSGLPRRSMYEEAT